MRQAPLIPLCAYGIKSADDTKRTIGLPDSVRNPAREHHTAGSEMLLEGDWSVCSSVVGVCVCVFGLDSFYFPHPSSLFKPSGRWKKMVHYAINLFSALLEINMVSFVNDALKHSYKDRQSG